MAKRGIKETLLSTLTHGEEVLTNIEVMRRTSRDKIDQKPVDSASSRIHPKRLNLVLNEVIDTKKVQKCFVLFLKMDICHHLKQVNT